jgi:nucleoid DNA-binding protein
MIISTEKLLKYSAKVSKNDLTEAVNTVLDCVHTNLDSKPEHAAHARKMY